MVTLPAVASFNASEHFKLGEGEVNIAWMSPQFVEKFKNWSESDVPERQVDVRYHPFPITDPYAEVIAWGGIALAHLWELLKLHATKPILVEGGSVNEVEISPLSNEKVWVEGANGWWSLSLQKVRRI